MIAPSQVTVIRERHYYFPAKCLRYAGNRRDAARLVGGGVLTLLLGKKPKVCDLLPRQTKSAKTVP